MFGLKTANETIDAIDRFLTLVDEAGIIFTEGIKSYLSGQQEHFLDKVKKLSHYENEGDAIRRQIANVLYTESLMPQLRSDILKLLEDLDNLLDISKACLVQFDIEHPKFPELIIPDLILLTEASAKASMSVVPGAKDYFRRPMQVRDSLNHVFLYEKEADRIGEMIKRTVYNQIAELTDLAHKNQIRYFVSKIEELSDAAEAAADLLLIMAVKRSI
ncbi:MAG TPA: DUF47 family protein [Salinivirgaceae bacterium]|nr:DUF47 family protein [Salinivirgaceae bacterium]